MANPKHRSLALPTFSFLVALTGVLEARAASDLVAVVGDVSISAAELEEQAQGRLLRLRSEQHALQQQVLEETIARVLVEREAKARGISTTELVRIEVESRVAPITDAEARAAYEITAERSSSEPAPEALRQVASGLRQRRINDRRETFVRSLREKAGVRVLLEPPRLVIDSGDGPAKGPKNAPITIVEFSEFQCSYCARASSTLKQLQVQYGDKLRIVFRHFPLPSHKEAAKASEAALCASEQQKFWEMHDGLFANQSRLQLSDLRQRAADLALDLERFNDCLDSGRHAQNVQADVVAGSRYGVSGTPAFFINGRSLVGAAPYEQFVRLIDEELARAAASSSSRESP